jgi:hypothetical protein
LKKCRTAKSRYFKISSNIQECYNFINLKGKLLFTNKSFQYAGDFKKGLTPICEVHWKRDKWLYYYPTLKWTYINHNGTIGIDVNKILSENKIHYRIVKCNNFNKFGFATFVLDGNYGCGLIDTLGRVILRPEYDFIYDYLGNWAAVQKRWKIGFINSKAESIVKPKYDGLEYFDFDYAIVFNNFYRQNTSSNLENIDTMTLIIEDTVNLYDNSYRRGKYDIDYMSEQSVTENSLQEFENSEYFENTDNRLYGPYYESDSTFQKYYLIDQYGSELLDKGYDSIERINSTSFKLTIYITDDLKDIYIYDTKKRKIRKIF